MKWYILGFYLSGCMLTFFTEIGDLETSFMVMIRRIVFWPIRFLYHLVGLNENDS